MFLDEDASGYTPQPDLAAFLEPPNEPPIYIGFGSLVLTVLSSLPCNPSPQLASPLHRTCKRDASYDFMFLLVRFRTGCSAQTSVNAFPCMTRDKVDSCVCIVAMHTHVTPKKRDHAVHGFGAVVIPFSASRRVCTRQFKTTYSGPQSCNENDL